MEFHQLANPIDETLLETTIGYEHVAVDLIAWPAQNGKAPAHS